MRKITKEAVEAFYKGEYFKKSNTKVVNMGGITHLYLHGNRIAFKFEHEKTVCITTAGWNTRVTRERLNGLKNCNLFQIKGVLYLNNNVWDGVLEVI